MKLQNIYINDRFDHVIDYDSNSEFVENFVLQSPFSDSMELITFNTIGDPNIFAIETDSETAHCYLRNTEMILDEKKEGGMNELKIIFHFSTEIASFIPQPTPKNEDDPFLRRREPVHAIEDTDVQALVALLEGKAALKWIKAATPDERVLLLEMKSLSELCVKISVEFELSYKTTLESRTGTQKIVLFVGPSRAISDVILDFGSEATQMAVFSRDERIEIDGFSDLFTNIKGTYRGESGGENEQYYQYDASNSRFFRSHFFIKKEFARRDINGALEDLSLSANSNLLKILTTKSEVQDMRKEYFVSPNIKLASYGGIELPKVKIDNRSISTENVGGKDCYFFYRSSISLFLQQALKELILNDAAARFVSFHFLMPNVYRQAEIVKILRLLQGDIASLLQKEEYVTIWGFEVTAVSESDASVMGVCEFKRHTNEQPAEGNYLLLDAGKGTLDFSLVRYEFDKEKNRYTYENLWRSGIIGAGNSLTYAYLLGLLHQYLDERYEKDGEITDSELRQFIYRNILGQGTENSIRGAGDAALLLNMMRAVDRYKMYSSQEGAVREKDGGSAVELDKIELGGFIAWLEECVDVEGERVEVLTHHEYIDQMIESLVNETMDRIYRMQAGRSEKYKIDYVIFAGRAFLLKLFKVSMFNALYSKYEVEEVEFMSQNAAVSMKDICMVCVDPIRMGDYNRKILSEPVLIQQNEPANQQVTNNKEKNTTNIKSAPFEKILRVFKTIVGLSSQEEVSLEETNDNPFKGNNLKEDAIGFFENVFASEYSGRTTKMPLKGFEWGEVKNPKMARVNIGGVIHPLAGIGKGKIRVFFNGEKYIIRSAGKSMPLLEPMALETSSFLQSSFFPNFSVDERGKLLLLPKIRAENAGSKQDENEKNNNEDKLVNDNESRPLSAPFSDLRGDQLEELINKL